MEAFKIQRITRESPKVLRDLLRVFGDAFADAESYNKHPPANSYLERLLGSDYFIVIAAVAHGEVVGGLAAYELTKFEQERSEIYIYDLAVAEAHRCKGIATALITELARIAAERGACVIFVQADREDTPAIELYSKFGHKKDVFHFDINVSKQKS